MALEALDPEVLGPAGADWVEAVDRAVAPPDQSAAPPEVARCFPAPRR